MFFYLSTNNLILSVLYFCKVTYVGKVLESEMQPFSCAICREDHKNVH